MGGNVSHSGAPGSAGLSLSLFLSLFLSLSLSQKPDGATAAANLETPTPKKERGFSFRKKRPPAAEKVGLEQGGKDGEREGVGESKRIK